MPKLIARTGCHLKCTERQFSLEIKEADLNWETDWVSEVIIGLGAPTSEKRIEYYTYDLVRRACIFVYILYSINKSISFLIWRGRKKIIHLEAKTFLKPTKIGKIPTKKGNFPPKILISKP